MHHKSEASLFVVSFPTTACDLIAVLRVAQHPLTSIMLLLLCHELIKLKLTADEFA